MRPLRIVFDTNAFSGANFDVLESGPMRALCRKGRIAPVYGHVFFEETLRAYGNEGKRNDLVNRWLPFIVETCDRICNDFVGIFHDELVRGLGPHAPKLLPSRDYERVKAAVQHIPLDGSWRAWHASQPELSIEDGKKAAQREISKQIRQEVADWRKAVRYSRKRDGRLQLDNFLNAELDQGGREFLINGSIVESKDPAALYDRWSRAKAQYPYFTMFVLNMAYIAHYAADKPNDPIDMNAQADLDIMTHLMHADAVVSNETGFFRTAFDDLWRSRGKIMFNSVEFGRFLDKL
jgi:hypothetical protein